MGWCQFGAPDEVPKIKNRAQYEKSLTKLPEQLDALRLYASGLKLSAVERLATKAGVGMPEVAIYEGKPNAFATGAFRNSALVAVSTGLLQSMSHEEVEAVLAHEVAHVANGDMVTLTLIQGVVNTFVVFLSCVVGYIVDKAVFRTERGTGPGYFIDWDGNARSTSDPGGGYLCEADTVARYVANRGGTTITVIDAATNKVVQTIDNIEAPEVIQFSRDRSQLYIFSRAENFLIVMDRKSSKIVKKVPISGWANEAQTTKDGKLILVCIWKTVWAI